MVTTIPPRTDPRIRHELRCVTASRLMKFAVSDRRRATWLASGLLPFNPACQHNLPSAYTRGLLAAAVKALSYADGSDMSRARVAQRTSAFAASPIQQLSILAQQCRAINLAEGFPDFPAPDEVKEAAVAAIKSDYNQYRHVQGVCDKVANAFFSTQGVKVDPTSQVTVCCGQSEAMAATIFAVIDPGDEVLLLDPAYETYEACVVMAGGKPVYVSLDPPEWNLDLSKLESAMGPRTKAIIVNSPHNPTGKVFTRRELEGIANLCCKHDCLAVTDEVYEHITFDSAEHLSLASLPGMQQRTVVTSSLSKTFSVTGWRVGWAIAPAEISAAISNIHVKLTDSAPAPFQEAALVALEQSARFYQKLKQDYTERRDFVCGMLAELGFEDYLIPQGSFFVFVKLPQSCKLTDVELSAHLIRTAGVAVVPGRGFFHLQPEHSNVSRLGNGSLTNSRSDGSTQQSEGKQHLLTTEAFRNSTDRYVRIAFCKNMATLREASKALSEHAHVLRTPQSQPQS